MEEETTTKYELTEENVKIHDRMRSLMTKPKFVQNYAYHKGSVPRVYEARVIVDKEDRISVIDKTFNLRIGANGLFIKQGKFNSGVTYHKKGRSSARVRYWGSTGVGHNKVFSQYDTLKGIAKEINPDCMEILDKEVIRNVGTQGMYGSIIAGKTDTLTKAMEYYIRYSLRGVGIDMEQADNMYRFIDGMQYGVHQGIKALRVAKYPNEVLELASSSLISPELKKVTDNSSSLTDLALMCGEKVDWTRPGFNVSTEEARLRKKSDDIGKWLDMWEGGPMLEDKTPQKAKEINEWLTPVVTADSPDDLPF